VSFPRRQESRRGFSLGGGPADEAGDSAKVPLSWILGTECFGKRVEEELQRAMALPGGLWTKPSKKELSLSHGLRVGTGKVSSTGRLGRRRLRRFLSDLLWENTGPGATAAGLEGVSAECLDNRTPQERAAKMEILRIKGAVWLAPESAEVEEDAEAIPHVVQGVYDLFEVEPFQDAENIPEWMRENSR